MRCAAQDEIWEFSPYRIQVWLAFDAMPEFNPAMYSRITAKIPEMASIVDHSGWVVNVADAPNHFRYSIINELAELELTPEELEMEPIAQGDKLIMVGVRREDSGFSVHAREFDCRSQMWSTAARRDVVSAERLPAEIFRAVAQAFVPVARILEVDESNVRALLRAGGLLVVDKDGVLTTNKESPAWIPENAVLIPVMRRTLRKKVKGKVQAVQETSIVEWTFANVDQVDLAKEPELVCTIYSAMRAPLGGKRGSRNQRTLRLAKPNLDATALYLTNRDKEPKPVAGYEIYSVLPGAKESKLLGTTDWEGSIALERGSSSLQILYVRSGSRVLARLPVVPGLYGTLTAKMFSDDVRLRAEGIVRGMQNNLLNLIATRQSLSVQTRAALEKKEVDKANLLMDEFRKLETGSAFFVKLEEQAKGLEGKDAREQEKISAMFNELRRLVGEHLSPELNTTLTREVEHVKNGGNLSDILPSIDEAAELK